MRRLIVLGLLGFTCILAAEPTDPRKPAAIETREVPVLSAQLVARLQQYQNMRGAAFSGWDPDGKGMLVRTRFGNSLQLHRVYEPGGRREQITFQDEPVSGRFLPQSQQEEMLLTLSVGGSENNQVYFFDRRKFETRLLTDGKSRHGIGAIRPDGERFILSSNKRNGRDTDLYLVDPRKPGSVELLLATDGEFWSAVDWSQDGNQLLLLRTVSANESYPALFDLKTKKRTDLPSAGPPPAKYSSLRFAKDGASIFLACDANHEFQRLLQFEIASGTYEGVGAEVDADVEEIEIHPGTGRIAFTSNVDGVSRLYEVQTFDKRGRTVVKRMPLPLGIVSSLEFSPDGKQLGFTFNKPDAPADAYSYELSSHQLTRWTFSEIGGLDPAKFITPTAVKFKSFDDRLIPAWYYKPATASPTNKVPVLINIHGGPEGQAQPFFSGTTQFYLNELNVAVLAPNVRGSSGYGKTYLKLDNADKREDSVRDIGALLDWIKERPELDASRVAVSGTSYGGYMVLASLVHYGERIKAGIDIVGIADFTTFLEQTAAYRRDLRRVEYGDERDPRMREVFARISPAGRADQIRSALLVAHGRNDPRVPFGEAELIASRVRAQGKPVWTVYAENEGHGFAKKDNADYLRAVEAAFVLQVFEPAVKDAK